MIGLLLSGGLDSSSLAFMCKPDIAFNINYGQKAAIAERKASNAICGELGITLIEIDVDCQHLGSGDLVARPELEHAPESDWWPYRNQLLITLCATKAIEIGCKTILIGSIQSDQYHADSTKGFIDRISDLLSFQEGALKVEAPAINMTASELIINSNIPKELLLWSHSCHKSNIPCGNCRGCNKHFNTLKALGYYRD